MRDIAIGKMKAVFGSDERRINHALKVLAYSEEILQKEKMEKDLEEVVVLTAIFHDIGIQEAERKYDSNSGKYQEIEGPPIARQILGEMNVQPAVIDRVCYIIGGHHTPSKVDGADFQVIWEADLLVNMQEEEWNVDGSRLPHILEKNFKTRSGRQIAKNLFQ